MKRAGRILAGIFLGPLVGNLAAIPFAFAIDAVYGAEVTGLQWHLNLPNIIYFAIMSLLTGFFAAVIAGRRGWLIGALAQFAPLELLILLATVRNRDILSMYEVPPATWAWIGLLPAIVGGLLGERALRSYRSRHQPTGRAPSMSLNQPVSGVRSSLAAALRAIGYTIWTITGLWAFFISLAIVNDVAGLWGLVIAFSIAPITFIAAPWYALVAWGNWFPLFVGYGGSILAGSVLLIAALLDD